MKAQTGPGGVGTTDGLSNLRLWLDADNGVSPSTDGSTITGWTNQAGASDPWDIQGNPTFQTNVVGGQPAVRFDGDGDLVDFTSLSGVPNGENTIIAVSATTGDTLNQVMLGFGSIGDEGAPKNARGLLYDLDNQTASIDIVLAAISGDAKGKGKDKLNSGDKAVSTSYNTTPFNIYSSTVETQGQASQDLLANGDFLDDGDASTLSATPAVGERLIGDVAEVIAFNRRANAAELTLIHNYLSTKYGVSLSGDIADVYGYDGSFPGDVAGVGTSASSIRNAPAGNQTVAQSSGLYLDVGSALPNDPDYVLYGHDEANFSFTSNEPPNDRSNIEKLSREWRVDMTSRSSLTGVTMGFDESTLPASEQLPSNSYNDYYLYVDSDGDFSDGDATAYDLESQGGGLYTNSSVDIDDGDYVTVAHIKRTVSFSKALDSEFEDVAGSVSVSIDVNFTNSTSLSIPYSVANGSPAPTQGSDYSVNSGSFSVSAGATTASATPFTVNDDGVSETNTEFVNVSFGSLPSNVSGGATTLFEFGILDDENARKIDFVDSNPTSVQEGNSGTKTQTFTVTLPDGMTGPATVTYRTSGTATAGEDYDIVSESDPSATSGTVTIPNGSQTGSFDIDILGDELDEGADESFTIDLIAVEDGTLDPSGLLSTTFTITDDDPIPEVQFTSSSFSGEEGTNVDVTVELAEPSGQDLDVTIQDDGTGSASDSGVDYTFPGSNTITVSAGDTQESLSISLSTDSQIETTETIDVSITDAGTEPPLASTGTSATVSILDASGIGNTGPGGVGNASSVQAWLQSDKGVTTSGGTVSTWADQSGNGNDATQSTASEQPAYATTTMNGIDVLTFDGSDDFLRTNIESLPGGKNTVFAVASASSSGAPFGVDDGSFNSLRTLEYTGASTAAASQDGTTVGGESASGTAVLTSAFDGSNVTISVNGNAGSSTGGAAANTNGVYAFVGGEVGNAGDSDDPDPISENSFDGHLGEFVAYDATLNKAQKLIVTNYLGAKYGISSLATDLYAGDSQGGSADRDADVLGVGQAADGSKHVRAEGGGLVISVRSGLDNSEFVLAGRKMGVEKRVNINDVSGVSGLTARLNDDRYLDITGTLSVDLSFDFSKFGVGDVAGDVSNYVLLRRGGTSGDWSTVSTGGISVSGDVVTFTDVSLSNSDDGYFTIGTTDVINSPLINSWGRTVAGTRGADGSDAGWRMIGVPVQGATIDDVQPPISIRRHGFTTHSVPMDYHWSLDNGGSNTTGWTELSSGDAIPNGRGFILYLYDDQYYPLDTEIPLDVEMNSGVPGSQNVTVGDNAPGFDTPLRTDTTWHLLANPYAQSYDLSSLNLSRDGDGDSSSDFVRTVQAWEAPAGTYVLKNNSPTNTEVAPWQAFFVERSDFDSGAATTLTFDSGGRTTGASLIGSKSTKPDSRQIGFRVMAYGEDGQVQAQDKAASLFFHPEAGPGPDFYDATKLVPFARSFVALAPVGVTADGEDTLRAQASFSSDLRDALTVPMELQTRNLSASEFELETPHWENIPNSWDVTLIDTKGTTDPSDDQELVWSEDTSYTFSSLSSTAKSGRSDAVSSTRTRSKGPVPSVRALSRSRSSRLKSGRTRGAARRSSKQTAAMDTARFVVKVQPGTAALPVEMSTFTARSNGTSIVLNWSTASEADNVGFYVQHQRLSADDSTSSAKADAWKKQAFVEGAGTADAPRTYQHRIGDLEYGRHAFRLRQVDKDGDVSYTETVEAEVRLTSGHAVTAPYPNPVRQQATVDVAVRESQPVRVTMYDVLGRRIRTVYDDELAAQRTKKIRIGVQDLASGVYFVRVKGDGFTETTKMTVVQ